MDAEGTRWTQRGQDGRRGDKMDAGLFTSRGRRSRQQQTTSQQSNSYRRTTTTVKAPDIEVLKEPNGGGSNQVPPWDHVPSPGTRSLSHLGVPQQSREPGVLHVALPPEALQTLRHHRDRLQTPTTTGGDSMKSASPSGHLGSKQQQGGGIEGPDSKPSWC